jgi:hypothetical protein
MTCHDTPNLSLSQPHCTSYPPAESFSPVVVDFGLGFAVEDERDRLGELEVRPAIQRREALSFELERYRYDGPRGPSGRLRALVVVAGDVADPRILEDRGVKLHASSALLSNHRNGVMRCSAFRMLYLRRVNGRPLFTNPVGSLQRQVQGPSAAQAPIPRHSSGIVEGGTYGVALFVTPDGKTTSTPPPAWLNAGATAPNVTAVPEGA